MHFLDSNPMKIERPQPTRADAALLRNTVWKLTAALRIFTVAVVAVAALVWWSLLHKIIDFGQGLDYSGLDALGAQVAAFVRQYNPFFWWAVVALCTLIIAYIVFGFVGSMNRRARNRRVDAVTVQGLAAQLSPAAIRVLQWSWQNRREPITVGVLQRARNELQHGRAAQIHLAEQHAALLEASGVPPENDAPLPST